MQVVHRCHANGGMGWKGALWPLACRGHARDRVLSRLVLAISAASIVSIPRSERSLSHYASARLRSSRPHRPGRTTTSGICYPLNTIALDRQISFAQVIRPSRFLAEPEEAP